MSSNKRQSRGKPGYKKLNREARRAQRRRRQQMRSVGTIVVGAVILVTAIILINTSSTVEPRVHPQADGNAMGDPNAPVVIEEYSDFQCSHCRDFFLETEQQLVELYVATGIVRYVYRSFGDFLGSESALAAQAAYCAEDQDMFWEMHDAIFSSYPPFSESALKKLAKRIDLDSDVFEECLNNEKYLDRVMEDKEDGEALGVNGTPAFVINGVYAFSGNRPIEAFQQYIEAALETSGN